MGQNRTSYVISILDKARFGHFISELGLKLSEQIEFVLKLFLPYLTHSHHVQRRIRRRGFAQRILRPQHWQLTLLTLRTFPDLRMMTPATLSPLSISCHLPNPPQSPRQFSHPFPTSPQSVLAHLKRAPKNILPRIAPRS